MSWEDDLRTLDALVNQHAANHGNKPDGEGKVAGYSEYALRCIAARQAQVMVYSFGHLPKVLTPEQLAEVKKQLRVMWADGFVAGLTAGRQGH